MAHLDFISELPSALSAKVLAQLGDHCDLAAASSVCRRWRDVAADGTVWAATYAARFPAWGTEQALPALGHDAAPQAWQQRYRWRWGVDRRWRRGRRQLQHVLQGHTDWVNAVRLVPGGGGVAAGGSEGAVHVWGMDGEARIASHVHSQAVWVLDADERCVASGAMDGYLNILDLGSELVTARLPVGWRGATGAVPGNGEDPDDLQQQFDVVTSVQLLPGGQQVLAGCMDGSIQRLDLRCPRQGAEPVQQLRWGTATPAQQQAGGAGAPAGLFWWRGARLCGARCHEHLLVAGGDAPAVTLHDMRMGGARFAELALPAGAGRRAPAVFALDLLYPRLATAGDRGQLQVWDLSRLGGAASALPAVPPHARPRPPRTLYTLWPHSSAPGGSTPRALPEAVGGGREGGEEAGEGDVAEPQTQQQQAAQQQQQQQAPPGWPSPSSPWGGGLAPAGGADVASSSAAASVDCLLGCNEYHLQQGLQMGCVYGVRIMEDWRVLTADHAGYVRLWSSTELVGARSPCLAACPAFAPSVDDPASALVDPQGGPPRPVGMHCLDACLTHLAVAGRDSVVRLYSYD